MTETFYEALLRTDKDDTILAGYLKGIREWKKSDNDVPKWSHRLRGNVNSALSVILNHAEFKTPADNYKNGTHMLNRATLSMVIDFEEGKNTLTISPRRTCRTNTLVWLYIVSVLRGHDASILTADEANMKTRIEYAVNKLPANLQEVYYDRKSNIISQDRKRVLFCSDFEFISSEYVERHIINGDYDQYVMESTVNRFDNTNYDALVSVIESKNFTIKTFSPEGVGITEQKIKDMKAMLNHEEDVIQAEIYCTRKKLDFVQV